jgi:DNA-binding beta-propeller fold protein YncE
MPDGRALHRRIVPGRAGACFLLLLPLPLFPQGNYSLVADWPLPARTAAGSATPWNLIQVPGVAVDSRGNVLVLHRGAHPVLVFDPAGKFIRSWGDGIFSEGKVAAVATNDRTPGASGYSAVYGAAGCDSCGVHSIRVDSAGNIWVVDAPGHVVYKMNAQGKVLLQLGRKGIPGTTPTNFNLPTDVAFASNGDIYVSDGYGNPRVVKYSREGKYLLQWGKRGSGPGEFQLPHNIVVDARDRVYVTDRDNRRVEVFDAQGKFLTEWRDIGGVSALAITGDQHIWTGGVLRSLDGKPVDKLAGEVPTAHGIAVGSSGEVYVAQLSGAVQKFVRK